MDKIKVGEYVRTKCGIAKIKEISILYKITNIKT